MYFRSILSGTLAILLTTGAVAQADGRAGILDVFKPSERTAGSGFSLPDLFGTKQDAPPIQLAQAGDPRITALEEQIRSLSGTLEELNFQILQMQEQMRKMQEDNEFRFQELEQKRTDAGTEGSVASVPARDANRDGGFEDGEAVGVPMQPEILVDNGTGDPADVPSAGTGTPPQVFGTITFDEGGNVTGGSLGGDTTQSVAGEAVAPGSDSLPGVTPRAEPNMQVAALPSSDNPEELYRNSYEFILSGDYPTAEAGFRDHVARFPQDQKAADAQFWLGEALLAQKKYRDAAEVFLAANKEFPSSKKAPDMLLKLGIALVGLDQRDVACATFSEVGRRYADMSGALKERVKQEQALAAC